MPRAKRSACRKSASRYFQTGPSGLTIKIPARPHASRSESLRTGRREDATASEVSNAPYLPEPECDTENSSHSSLRKRMPWVSTEKVAVDHPTCIDTDADTSDSEPLICPKMQDARQQYVGPAYHIVCPITDVAEVRLRQHPLRRRPLSKRLFSM